MKKRSGFTLIELLIVIGIIAILAGIVIIAVNPSKQFGQANDAQRQSDVNAILNAVSQYTAENRGLMPTGVTLTSTPAYIASTTGTGMVALCNALVPNYISAMPYDPTGSGAITTSFTSCSTTPWHTGYRISESADGRLTVDAPFAEQTTEIEITR